MNSVSSQQGVSTPCHKKTSHCSSTKVKKHKHCGSKASQTSQSSSPSGKGPSDKMSEIREKCYDKTYKYVHPNCEIKFVWQNGKYLKDECGSGIVPNRFDFSVNRKVYCQTPLSMYQATIGEMGRQVLCKEKIIQRDIKPGPPCNVCENILPPCRGYYRKYDCIRPCEEEYAVTKRGVREYRNPIDRYWQPCLTADQKTQLDINSYAGQNVWLGMKMRRNNHSIPCW